VSGQLHTLPNSLLGNDPGTHWMEGWLDPRASLDTMMKTKRIPSLPGNEPWSSSLQPSQRATPTPTVLADFVFQILTS